MAARAGTVSALFCLALLLPTPAAAQQAPQAALSERAQAQAEREALQAQIRQVEARMRAAEREQTAAADALRESEQAISAATRRLAELDTEGKQLQAEQARLRSRQQALDADLQRRQAELAALIRHQYQHGGDSPWQALLSGNDPHEAGRRLGYLGYVSRARAQLVRQIADERAELAQVVAELAQRQARWDEVRREQAAQHDERLRQQAQRRQVLERIAADLAAQRTQADRLKTDAERLSELIAEINQALARQAAERARRDAERAARDKAEAAAREARAAAERVAQARQAAERAAAENAAAERARALVARDPLGLRPDEMSTPPPGDAGAATPPAGSAPVAALAMREGVDRASPAPAAKPAPGAGAVRESGPVPFATLRGRLPLPARGTLAGRFGEDRPDGGSWRGIFIQASSGTPVRAVAGGTVVFSGWLRGFGNLLILDHGNDYLTVYGNNEAILKQVGDAVAAGDVVANAGTTGGLTQSGIYFEIRHRGAPVDPLSWANSP